MYSYPLYSWLAGDGAKKKGHGGRTYISFKANYGSNKNSINALNLTVRRTETSALVDAELAENIPCHIGSAKQKTIIIVKNGLPHVQTNKGLISVEELLSAYTVDQHFTKLHKGEIDPLSKLEVYRIE